MGLRFCKDRLALSSRITIKKKMEKIWKEHFHYEVPMYNIDIDILPRFNVTYYGRPGNCFVHLDFSWIVWDLSLCWESNGLPPKRVRPKQTERR